MSKIYFRHKIQEGTQIKIPSKVYTGTDSTGAVFWKFVAVLSDEINGEVQAYDYVWLKAKGQPVAKCGEYVQVKRILGLSSTLQRNATGGKIVYRTLEVEFEKVERYKEDAVI